MRISFDIDDTLRMHGEGYPVDKNRVPWLMRFVFKERLRRGSYELFKKLQNFGHEICVYTTSTRSLWYIKWWFRFYGVRLELIVNQDVHCRAVKGINGRRRPSKNPAKFGVDLHVDDLEGVAGEGEIYGFKVLVVAVDDDEWDKKVLDVLQRGTIG